MLKARAAKNPGLQRYLAVPLMLTMSLLAACTSPSLSLDNPSEKNLSFTILHTNDIHSHNDSFTEGGRSIGGLPRIAHLIKTLKTGNDKVLAIDAGDIFQGTPYFEQYHGQAEIECLNKAGYDIYTIGNHEFDDGATNLGKQLSLARFDVLNCNMDFGTHQDLSTVVKPSVIKTIDGQKVGFIGVITPELSALSTKLEGVKLKATGQQWMEPVKLEVEKLKAGGINKIVVVSHSGVDFEKALAREIPEIDIIVGGHSHTRLEQPIIVKHDDDSVCYVMQTGCYTRALGRLDVTFDPRGKIIIPGTKYRLTNITEKVFEDPAVKAYVTDMGKPFAYLRTTTVATAEANFENKFRSYPFDSPIGDLICDALVDGASQYGATIALQNRGGIRGKIEQGLITLETIREILPFENHLIVATINGTTLLKALENSVAGMSGGRFLDVKGLKFSYDPMKEPGKRIVFAYAEDKEGTWEPIAADDLYRIALNSYSFGGGESFDFSSAKDVVDTGKRLSVVLQEYLEKKKTVHPQLPSRLVAVATGVASINRAGGKPRLKLVYKEGAGGEVTLLAGAGEGVEFVPRIGVVPLREAEIIGTGKLNADGEFQRELKITGKGNTSQKSAKRKREDRPPSQAASVKNRIVAVIKTGEQGSFTKIVTAPLQVGD